MSRWTIFLGLIFTSAIAVADPIYYDESVDGDLSDSTADPLFEFDFGDNVIIGSSQIGGELTGLDDNDRFSFELTGDAFLSSLIFEFSGGLTPGSDETIAQMFLRIVDASGAGRCTLAPRPNVLAGEGSITYSSCRNSDLSWSDLDAGTYYLQVGLWGSPDGTTGDSWNYSLTFSVDDASRSVPEPGTLSLLGVGLLAIGASRRRRKT